MTGRFLSIAKRLDRLAGVYTEQLIRAVVSDGACMTALTRGEPPELTGERDADHELAESVCSGCPRQWECLELEMRWSGPHQHGVFGALPDEDRRALFPVWMARRSRGGGRS